MLPDHLLVVLWYNGDVSP